MRTFALLIFVASSAILNIAVASPRELMLVNSSPVDVVLLENTECATCAPYELKVRGKKVAEASYFSLNDPSRLVIDLPGLMIATPPHIPVLANSLIKAVRFGLHKNSTRIVLDLSESSNSKIGIIPSGDGMTFSIGAALRSAAEAAPSLSISQLSVTFSGSDRVQDLTIRNTGEVATSVECAAELLNRPGNDEQTSEPTADLIISPRSITLEPSEERKFRLSLKSGAPEKERNYTVVLVTQKKSHTTTTARLPGNAAFISVAVDSLPEEIVPNLRWSIVDQQLVLENLGNASVFLDSGRVCGKESSECTSLPSYRIYPLESVHLAVNGMLRAEFLQRQGENSTPLVIPISAPIINPSTT